MTTTVFDGNCVLCKSTKAFVTALDWFNRVEWLDLHNRDEVDSRYPWLDYERAMGEIHVIDSEEEVYAGYYGVRRMFRDLPLGLPIWAVLAIPGMDRIGKRAYGYIARHRYEINRFFGVELDPCEDGVCKIPTR
ncbi:MAG: DUF393 domain-containing protein [Chloroflexota bacterium]